MVWGGSTYAWGSSTIIGLLIVSAIAAGLFVMQERRASEPILPQRLFKNSIFTMGSAVGFLVGIAMFGAIVYLPVFLQVVTGASATDAGLLLMPLMLGIIIMSVVSGRLISRTGRYRVFPIVGTALMVLGFGLLATFDVDTSRTEVALAMVVIGCGLGNTMQVLVLAVQNSVDHADLGIATSASMFFRSIGGTVGIALFGAILNNRLTGNLTAALGSANVEGLGELNADNITQRLERVGDLPPDIAHLIRGAVADSLHVAFLVGVPLAVLAFLLSFRLKEIPLRETAHVGSVEAVEGAVPVEHAEDLRV
jgi:predicted MFS family arabinose efflux permease